MAKPAQWKKLAVRMRDVDPRSLTTNPKNWRIHGAAQREALRGSIHELGYGDPVELMDGTDLILDGHLRVDLAIQEGQETITVVDMALYTESEADQYLLTKDPIAAMANADKERLDTLMRENSTSEAAVQAMLAAMAEREGITPPFDAAAEWQGMPEFHQEDKTAAHQCIVNFATEEDMRAFEAFLGQRIPQDRKSIWYPEVRRQHNPDYWGTVDDAA